MRSSPAVVVPAFQRSEHLRTHQASDSTESAMITARRAAASCCNERTRNSRSLTFSSHTLTQSKGETQHTVQRRRHLRRQGQQRQASPSCTRSSGRSSINSSKSSRRSGTPHCCVPLPPTRRDGRPRRRRRRSGRAVWCRCGSSRPQSCGRSPRRRRCGLASTLPLSADCTCCAVLSCACHSGA